LTVFAYSSSPWTISAGQLSRGASHARDRTQPGRRRHLDPLAVLVKDFQARGGTLWACTPCVKARGYTQEDLIEGVIITGASPMHELLKAGAATLSF
jgi:predicted peroxiredoxin